jgi:hypothetical protein
MRKLCDARAMRKPIATLFMALAAAPAWSAESPAAAVEKIVACAEVQGSAARLACFDREVAPLRQRSGSTVRAAPSAPAVPSTPARLPPVANVPAPSAAPPAATPAAVPSFGEEQLDPKNRKEAPAEQQALQGKISTLRQAGATNYLVTLDNGQVWRHEDAQLGSYLRVGDAITIRPGALGSYRLTRDAGAARNWIRVTRVR